MANFVFLFVFYTLYLDIFTLDILYLDIFDLDILYIDIFYLDILDILYLDRLEIFIWIFCIWIG